MKRANITETKNNLSRLIDEVKNGESFLILDRDVPVAMLEPVNNTQLTKDDWATLLVRQGLAAGPKSPVDLDRFFSRRKIKLAKGLSATSVLLADREDAR